MPLNTIQATPIDFSSFEYDSLPSPSSIRLLSFVKRPRQLSPPSILGVELLECILETVDIGDTPEFDIISSTCGNPQYDYPGSTDEYGPMHRYPIAVNGKLMFLSKNIYEAFKTIREVNDPVYRRYEPYNKTELIQAAEQGRLQDVEECLRQGAHIHAQDCHGETALHYAAENGNFHVVSLLLDHGASIKMVDSRHRTAPDCMPYKKKKEWKKVIESHERLYQDHEERQLIPAPEVIRIGRPIRIDAVCVNQSDDHEKASQGCIIPEIHARAHSVIGWAGAMSDDTKLAKRTITSLLHGDDADLSKTILTDKFPADHDTRYSVVKAKMSVYSLLARSWFQRTELMDEAAFGKPILIHCGEDAILLSDILEYLRRQTSEDEKELFSGLNVLCLLGDSSSKRKSDEAGGDRKSAKRDG
jgi:hypothetical protein